MTENSKKHLIFGGSRITDHPFENLFNVAHILFDRAQPIEEESQRDVKDHVKNLRERSGRSGIDIGLRLTRQYRHHNEGEDDLIDCRQPRQSTL